MHSGFSGATLRKLRGIRTQSEIGALVGKSVSAISYYESGGRTPRLDVVLELARALNVSPLELLAREGDA